jgi:hypothetical protein
MRLTVSGVAQVSGALGRWEEIEAGAHARGQAAGLPTTWWTFGEARTCSSSCAVSV